MDNKNQIDISTSIKINPNNMATTASRTYTDGVPAHKNAAMASFIPTPAVFRWGAADFPHNVQDIEYLPAQRRGTMNFYAAQYQGSSIHFTTPLLNLKFGVQENKFNKNKWSLDCEFDDSSADTPSALLMEWHRNLDTMTKNKACVVSEAWFGKPKTRAALDELFVDSVHQNEWEGRTYRPSIKYKVCVTKGRPACQVYNTKREEMYNPLNIDSHLSVEDMFTTMTKNTEVVLLVHYEGVWVVGPNLGQIFTVKQIMPHIREDFNSCGI